MRTTLMLAMLLSLVLLSTGCATTRGSSSGSTVNINGAVDTSVEKSF
jgi:hypothetical protein